MARGVVAGIVKEDLERDPKYTWRNTGYNQTDAHPVSNLTWSDAIAFCERLSVLEGLKPFDHFGATSPGTARVTDCRPRQNGSMPAGRERRPGSRVGMISSR